MEAQDAQHVEARKYQLYPDPPLSSPPACPLRCAAGAEVPFLPPENSANSSFLLPPSPPPSPQSHERSASRKARAMGNVLSRPIDESFKYLYARIPPYSDRKGHPCSPAQRSVDVSHYFPPCVENVVVSVRTS